MKLINRFKTELLSRLDQSLALSGSWQDSAVLCSLENIDLLSEKSIENEWQHSASLQGVLSVKLLVANVLTMLTETLINDLLANEIFLELDDAIAVNELSEKARFTLAGWKNELAQIDGQEQQIVVMSFNLEGAIAKKITVETIPGIYISQAPEIGSAHESSYVPLSEFTID